MSAVAAGLVAKSRLFGASFAGATRGISSRNALRPGGALLAYMTRWQLDEDASIRMQGYAWVCCGPAAPAAAAADDDDDDKERDAQIQTVTNNN